MIEVPDEVLAARLASRANFDDQEEAIKKRLATWNEKTKPVAAKYNAFVINGDRAANEVVADVIKALS